MQRRYKQIDLFGEAITLYERNSIDETKYDSTKEMHPYFIFASVVSDSIMVGFQSKKDRKKALKKYSPLALLEKYPSSILKDLFEIVLFDVEEKERDDDKKKVESQEKQLTS